jgi:hypothetical protein
MTALEEIKRKKKIAIAEKNNLKAKIAKAEKTKANLKNAISELEIEYADVQEYILSLSLDLDAKKQEISEMPVL